MGREREGQMDVKAGNIQGAKPGERRLEQRAGDTFAGSPVQLACLWLQGLTWERGRCLKAVIHTHKDRS